MTFPRSNGFVGAEAQGLVGFVTTGRAVYVNLRLLAEPASSLEDIEARWAALQR